MILELDSLDGIRRVEYAFGSSEIDLGVENAKAVSDTRFNGTIENASGRLILRASVKGAFELACVRCLAWRSAEFDFDFEAAYVRPDEFAAERERELSREDLDLDVVEGGQLNLCDAVREQLILNLPTQFLCKPDCRGLCQKCGVDLNVSDCECNDVEMDPRWAVLQSLK